MLTFAMSLMIFACLDLQHKVSEKSDMVKNPEALGFAACHKQELFVDQVLIKS